MLKRVRTDRIDLLYQHRIDPQVTIEDVAGAIKDLNREGRVLHCGLPEMGTNTLRRAHAELPLSAVQDEYSMLWRGPEDAVIPVCQELASASSLGTPSGLVFLLAPSTQERGSPTVTSVGSSPGSRPRTCPTTWRSSTW